jgi:lipid II:glycine glycyltransferase (peptidoglycan interpeptide bridge formation enzyme)
MAETMDEELKIDSLYEYMQKQEALFARLDPANELEERLARQIVVCSYKLEQIQHRLTKAWCQLNKIYEELKPEALS